MRRQAVSTARVKRRTASRRPSAPAASGRAAPRRRARRGDSTSGPPACCQCPRMSEHVVVGAGPARRAPPTRRGRRPNSIRCSGEAGVLRSVGGPPGHHLRLGAGQRDVEQAQRLPASSRQCRRDGGAVQRARDRRRRGTRRPSSSWNSGIVRVVADVAVPQRGQVDDGVLQALAAVDGDQLDGRGVGVEPAGALGGDLDLARRSPARAASSSSADERRAARSALTSCSASPMWREVGQGALAADPAEHPGGETGARPPPRARPRPRGCVSTSARVADALGDAGRSGRRRRRRARRRSARRTR